MQHAMRRDDEWNSAHPRDRGAMSDGCAPDAVQMQHARLQPLDDSEQRLTRRAPFTREIDQLNACFGEEPINPRALNGVAGAIDADDHNLRPRKRLVARELDHDRRRPTALGMKVLDDVEDHGRKVGVGSVSGRCREGSTKTPPGVDAIAVSRGVPRKSSIGTMLRAD